MISNDATQFNVTPREAIELQKKLRSLISTAEVVPDVKTIAGADISFNRFGKYAYACIIVFSYPDLSMLEYSCVRTEMKFPYVPGLLSFREIPSLLLAFQKLQRKPDVIIVDGHGIAHPRRLGIATHFSLATNTPTIGCAKSILFGTFKDPALAAGSIEPIVDPKTNETLGMVLRTKNKTKPVFVSPGNAISLSQSLEIIKTCLKGYRLPEPTRLAHAIVNEFRISSAEKEGEVALHKVLE